MCTAVFPVLRHSESSHALVVLQSSCHYSSNSTTCTDSCSAFHQMLTSPHCPRRGCLCSPEHANRLPIWRVSLSVVASLFGLVSSRYHPLPTMVSNGHQKKLGSKIKTVLDRKTIRCWTPDWTYFFPRNKVKILNEKATGNTRINVNEDTGCHLWREKCITWRIFQFDAWG